MSTVAFIGLGAMGARMAMNLHAAGHKLRVYNRDRSKTQPFASLGVEVCASPATAAKGAEFVVSIVADDVATRAVMLGTDGALAGAAPRTVLIDSSTNTPATARDVAKAAAAKGCQYLDAPVSGSLAQAQGKELVFMVGGDKAAFDRAQPVLAAMGRLAKHMGASGAGATIKLINNMLSGTVTAALAEAAQVVLLDGSSPLGNGKLLPAGPLREPVYTLSLADVFIITRSPTNATMFWFLQLAETYPDKILTQATIKPVSVRKP